MCGSSEEGQGLTGKKCHYHYLEAERLEGWGSRELGNYRLKERTKKISARGRETETGVMLGTSGLRNVGGMPQKSR